MEGKQKFTGTCNYYKKLRYKWADCFKRKADLKKNNEGGGKKEDNGSNLSSKKCWVCGVNHLKKDCPKRNDRNNNKLNMIFKDIMFCCEVQPGVIYKDVLMGEINMCIPTDKVIDEEVNEIIQADPSKSTIVIETIGNERQNLVNNENSAEELECNNEEYTTDGSRATTDSRANLTTILQGVLAKK